MSLRNLKRSKTKHSRKPIAGQDGAVHPGRLLQVAQGHLRTGNLSEAEKVYKEVIRAFPGEAAAYNDLGTLYHSRGRLDEAVEQYRKAIALDPGYPPALTNYGLILQDQGNLAEALLLFERVLIVNPNDIGALTNLGVARQRQGKLAEAGAAFQRVLAVSPNDIYALNNLASVLRDQGRLNDAADAYRKVIEMQPDLIDARIGLGHLLRKQGRYDEAVAVFKKAAALNPNHPEAWRSLGLAYSEQENFDEAMSAYMKILDFMPDDAEIITKVGILHQKAGRLEPALACFQKVLQAKPDFLPARESLVETLERYNKVDEAYEEALKGLELSPGGPSLNVHAAACERRRGEVRKGIERLSALKDSRLDPSEKRLLCFELGRLHDRAGEYDRAYESFAAGNLASQQLNRGMDKAYFLNRLAILERQFRSLTAIPAADPALHGKAPVFLFGFPRSGTTLLDQILDSHPMVRTMEEKDVVATLENRACSPFEDYLDLWQGLTPEIISELQDDYFREAEKYVPQTTGTVFIDRMPLNTMRAGLIWRIFPDAKFILAVRHPADVCLSCFMQDFKINAANANFFSLEEAANFYKQVMTLWRLYEEKLPLNYHLVRYEDLVADLETEARRLFDFLEVAWDEGVLRFHEHARTKGLIGTASYSQVTQKIYRHAAYRWQRYQKYLEPVRETLAPFVEYFGYRG